MTTFSSSLSDIALISALFVVTIIVLMITKQRLREKRCSFVASSSETLSKRRCVGLCMWMLLVRVISGTVVTFAVFKSSVPSSQRRRNFGHAIKRLTKRLLFFPGLVSGSLFRFDTLFIRVG